MSQVEEVECVYCGVQVPCVIGGKLWETKVCNKCWYEVERGPDPAAAAVSTL